MCRPWTKGAGPWEGLSMQRAGVSSRQSWSPTSHLFSLILPQLTEDFFSSKHSLSTCWVLLDRVRQGWKIPRKRTMIGSKTGGRQRNYRTGSRNKISVIKYGFISGWELRIVVILRILPYLDMYVFLHVNYFFLSSLHSSLYYVC